MNSKARQMEINLMTLGSGTILLGAWKFIKFTLTFLLYGSDINETYSTYSLPVQIISYILVWVFAALFFLMYFYIGKSARSEGKGKRKRSFYLILTGIFAAVGALGMIVEIAALFMDIENPFTLLITLIIDATTLVILIDLMVNAIGIRRLRRKEATA